MTIKELYKRTQKHNVSLSKALIENAEDLAACLDYFDLVDLIQAMAYVIHDQKLDGELMTELEDYTELLRD